MTDLAAMIDDLGRRARIAARSLAKIDRARKDAALLAMVDELISSAGAILAANLADVAASREEGRPAAVPGSRLHIAAPDACARGAHGCR